MSICLALVLPVVRRSIAFCFLATLGVITACGRVPDSGVLTSPSTGQTTASPSPSANPTAFAPGDCTYPSGGGTTIGPLGAHDMYFTIPSGWVQEDFTPAADDSQGTYALLKAPPQYGSGTTEIRIGRSPDVSEPYPAGTTAEQVVRKNYDAQVRSANGAVIACSVDGDSAAYIPVTLDSPRIGPTSGYWVTWLHNGYIFGLDLEATTGPAPQAIEDAKKILGSVTWAPVPSSAASPT